jgi:hypothetical protein
VNLRVDSHETERERRTMENLFTAVAKLRHPFSALTGAGIFLLVSVEMLDMQALSVAEVTIYSLAVIAIGAGFGGFACKLGEQVWIYSRSSRERLTSAYSRMSFRNKLEKLPENTRTFIGETISSVRYQSPSIEFENHELHHAEYLFRLGLVRRNPNERVFTFTRTAWELICEDPSLVGLKLTVERDIYSGEQRERFRYASYDA